MNYFKEITKFPVIYLLKIFTISRLTLYTWLVKYKLNLLLKDNKNIIHKRKYIRSLFPYKTISNDCKIYFILQIILSKIKYLVLRNYGKIYKKNLMYQFLKDMYTKY